MKHTTFKGKPIHKAALMYAEEFKEGKLSRREFLARTTSLGVAAATAYALGGLNMPAQAQATPAQGGTIKCQMSLRALKDTRTADWSEIANATRGTLEYLVEYNSDGSFRGMLLDSWETNDNATQYTLKVRPGVTWNNGDAFTAEDVARNIARWCERGVEGNSMAARVGGLIDDATDMARDGAIVVVDDMTVQLNLSAPDIAIIANFSDYPAAIVHSSYNPDQLQNVGTGPFIIEELEVGVKCVLARNTDHTWWGTDVYSGPYLENAPEFVLGYNRGYRTSWDCATGVVKAPLFEDNVKAWSGDHCMDPRLVPGVLFCNRDIDIADPALIDIAPTALQQFGIEPPKHMDGKVLQFTDDAKETTA